jgi:transcriptional regulator with XRE-family HTH domain
MAAKKSSQMQALGRTIRALRTEQGYSQDALAKRSGIDRSYLGAIERGEFNIGFDTLVRIAEALDISASEVCAKARL